LQVAGQERRETEALKLLHNEQKQKTALELLEQYLQYQKDAEGKEKSKREEKDPLKPKPPVTAFFAFTNECRAALLEENHNVLQIAKFL
jgi:upstream-binding transcription factor